jgi:hypothetical protein
MIVTRWPWYTPGALATLTAETPICRHCGVNRFLRCGGLPIHRFMARVALTVGEAQSRFSPTDQYE